MIMIFGMECTLNECTQIILSLKNIFVEQFQAFNKFQDTADEFKSLSLRSHLLVFVYLCVLYVPLFIYVYDAINLSLHVI